MDSAPPTKSSFIFEKTEGVDDSMKEYAKMCILLSLEEFPSSEDDWKKCKLVDDKFEEKYGNHWCSSFIKNGDVCFWYSGHYMKIKYKDYIIKIAKQA